MNSERIFGSYVVLRLKQGTMNAKLWYVYDLSTDRIISRHQTEAEATAGAFGLKVMDNLDAVRPAGNIGGSAKH